jgi:cytoskeletal protein CcmA (bactofilin family)
MKCLSELVYSMYADGEASPEEVRQVEEHLAACARCRSLVQALQQENRLLREALQAAEELNLEAQRHGVAGPLLGFLGMLGVTTAAVMTVTWVASVFPSGADWLNPFHRIAWFNWSFSSVLYLVMDGGNMLNSLVTALAFFMLAVVVASGLYWLFKKHSASMALLAALLLVICEAQPASAVETRKGQLVTIPAGETLNDTLMWGGDTLEIDGTVTGNVIAGGNSVVIRGTVKGDVIGGCHTLEIDGTVEGSVFAFCQALTLRGRIGGSAYAWVQAVRVEPEGRIEGDLVEGSGVLAIDGAVARDVKAFAGEVEVHGSIGRDLTAQSGHIRLTAPAHIGGNFTAHVGHTRDVLVAPGVTIGGKSQTLVSVESNPYTRPKFYFWQAVRLAASFVTGVVLFVLFPSLFGGRLETAGRVLKAAGTGFLVLVVPPIAALVLGITLVGLPVGLMMLGAWLVALYLAKILVAAVIGRGLLHSHEPRLGSFALTLLLGLVIVTVAVNLPYIGWLIALLVVLVGLGLGFREGTRRWRERTAV